jgi:hypothetical protein
MTTSPIIAFGHQSRVGKNLAAEGLRAAFGVMGIRVKVRSFAALLKAQAHYENPANAHLRDVALPSIGKTPVEIWIEYGMAVRGIYGATWSEAALAERAPGVVLIITDLRFDNEGDRIHDLGGYCIKITRGGQVVRGSDQSIRGDFPWNAHVANEGTPAALIAKAIATALVYLDGIQFAG